MRADKNDPTLRHNTEYLRTHPSVLIRLTLDDLRKVEADKRYVVKMDKWHEPQKPWAMFPAWAQPTKCFVCFAGARMAMTLGIPIGRFAAPMAETVGSGESTLLQALDVLRLGAVLHFLIVLGLEVTGHEPKFHVPNYSYNREGFHQSMHKIADYLETVGY